MRALTTVLSVQFRNSTEPLHKQPGEKLEFHRRPESTWPRRWFWYTGHADNTVSIRMVDIEAV
jgi:hypothetical protein